MVWVSVHECAHVYVDCCSREESPRELGLYHIVLHKKYLCIVSCHWAVSVICTLLYRCLTAVCEVLGSNCAAGSCVYRKNDCDLQPWAQAVCTLPAVPRSTQPSALRGTVNEYQLTGWVIIINGDGGCRR